MNKRLIIWCLIAFSFTSLHSQDSLKLYLNEGIGFSFHQLRNTNMSPLIYWGPGLMNDLGFYAQKKEFISELDFYIWGGLTSPTIYPERSQSQITLTRFDLDYSMLVRLNEIEKLRIQNYIGGTVMIKNSIRMHNAYYNNGVDYDLVTSMALSGASRKYFKLFDRKFETRYQLSVPFISYSIVPAYVSSLPTAFLTTSDYDLLTIIKSGSVVSFNEIQRVNSELSLTCNLKNGNALRLSYYWDFINNDIVDPIISANHSIYFSILFELNKPYRK